MVSQQVFVTDLKEIEETGNWQFALHLLDEGIEKESKASERRSQLFNATLEACLKERQWEMAIKLFEMAEVTFEKPAASAYNILMKNAMNAELGLVLDCALKKVQQTPKLLDVRGFTTPSLAVRWWLQRLVAPELSQQRQWYKCSIETSLPSERREILKLLRGMGLWPLVHPNLSRLDLEVSRQDLPTLRQCLMDGPKRGRHMWPSLVSNKNGLCDVKVHSIACTGFFFRIRFHWTTLCGDDDGIARQR